MTDSEKADLRPVRANFRPESAEFRPERADFRPERTDFGPDWADFRPEQVAQGQYVVSDTRCPALLVIVGDG